MTRLILIEGPVGAGKSTLAEWVGEHLRARGREVEQPHGFDPDHAITTRCERRARAHGRGEDLGELVVDETDELVFTAPQWEQLARAPSDTIFVFEGKYFQQCLEYPRHLGADADVVLSEQRRIVSAIAPLRPVLIYLGTSDLLGQIARVAKVRPPEWLGWLGGFFARHPWSMANGTDTVEAFYSAWEPLERELVRAHPEPKLELLDSHLDWERARERIATFLDSTG